MNYYDFIFFSFILFVIVGFNDDFLETDLIKFDLNKFDTLFDYYDIVLLLVNNVVLSSTFLALANNLFSINFDLLLDFDNLLCFDNIDGLFINISIFFV